MHTSSTMQLSHDNIQDELKAYGVARDVAKREAAKTDQTGTPVFGFKDSGAEYEITTGDPEVLDEYNVPFAIIAPDSSNFNLIVRKDRPNALHTLPMDKLRDTLSRILDSV